MSNSELSQALTDDQREVLQEITNIGMGLAGEQLAKILGQFVVLSIPRIEITTPNNLAKTVETLVAQNREMICVRQAFFSHWRGEAFALFEKDGCHEIAEVMGYSKELDPNTEAELLLDIANALIGACVNGVANQVNCELNFSPPSLYAQNVFPRELFATKSFSWSHVVALEVHFCVEQYRFASHLLILLAEESMQSLRKDLDNFLANL